MTVGVNGLADFILAINGKVVACSAGIQPENIDTGMAVFVIIIPFAAVTIIG